MAHFLQLLFYRKNAFVHVGNYSNVPFLCQLLWLIFFYRFSSTDFPALFLFWLESCFSSLRSSIFFPYIDPIHAFLLLGQAYFPLHWLYSRFSPLRSSIFFPYIDPIHAFLLLGQAYSFLTLTLIIVLLIQVTRKLFLCWL